MAGPTQSRGHKSRLALYHRRRSHKIEVFISINPKRLDASTSYFIVVANGNTTNSIQARYDLYITDSNAEDSTGLSDWSITNSGRTRDTNWSQNQTTGPSTYKSVER